MGSASCTTPRWANHIHIVCEADDHERLSRGMQGVCVRIAQTLNRWWERRGKVFADRFHSHVLRFADGSAQRARVRAEERASPQARAERRELDPFSSAAWFDGWSRTPGGSSTCETHCAAPDGADMDHEHRWKRLGLLDPGGELAHKRPRQQQRPAPLRRRTRTSPAAKHGSKITNDHAMYPTNDGILTPFSSAIDLTMKFGPLPMYVNAPIITVSA
jgi:hypothetical protein